MSQQKYGETETFPAWTDPEPGILEPLRLPEIKEKTPIFEDQDVECLLCEDSFNIPTEQQQFLKHLLSEHKFVIGDVNLISDFPAYVRYWKNKFARFPLASYCSIMKAGLSKGGNCASSKEQEFFFLSDILLEDKELRIHLQKERLEQVLAVQERERNDATFHRGCLFCRQNFTKHADLFNHMAFDHNFSVGQPDNLVFITQFLELVEKKLESLLCLFCEKTFKSRDVLKEHMRKKAHKKLNPSNKEYDRFYLVNYLEFGKTWQDMEKEGGEEEMPTGWDSDKDDGGDWSDWRGDLGSAVCLFCVVSYSDAGQLPNHMKEVHGFDFQEISANMKLTFYQQVKLVNYIRRQVHLNTCIGCQEVLPDRDQLLEHMAWSNHCQPGDSRAWDQPQYFFPTYENDNLLCGLEELSGVDTDDTGFCSEDSGGGVPVLAEDFPITESILVQDELRRSLLPGKRQWHSNSGSKSRDKRDHPK